MPDGCETVRHCCFYMCRIINDKLRIAIEWRSKFRRIIMTIRIDMVAKFATDVTFS